MKLHEIRPKDYLRIEKGFASGPCNCCGHSWVNYQERTKEPARRKICRMCYERAKEAETSAIRALPGVLNIAKMKSVFTGLGRCQSCDGGKAIWRDEEARVTICDRCYQMYAGDCTRNS